jgi:hypothetical protein
VSFWVDVRGVSGNVVELNELLAELLASVLEHHTLVFD